MAKVKYEDPVEPEPRGYEKLRHHVGSIDEAARGNTPEDMEQGRLRLHDAHLALMSLGYLNPSSPDAIREFHALAGAETAQALRAFQEDSDLPTHGNLDIPTYQALLAEYEKVFGAKSPEVPQDDFGPIHPEKPLAD